MLRSFALSILLLTCILPLNDLLASHLQGGTIRAECISACSTRFHVVRYKDCSGSTLDPPTLTFTPLTACSSPTPLGPVSPAWVTEVTPLCPTGTSYCTNPNANLNGVDEFHQYWDYNLCANVGCQYRVAYTSCCRNGAVNIIGMPGFLIFLDYTVGAQCNSTPHFTSRVQVNILQNLSQRVSVAAYDAEGDSLVYELSPAYEMNGMTVTYPAGFSHLQPLGPSWNVQLDPQTGMLDILATPGNITVGEIVIGVKEYRNGTQISWSMLDYTVVVLANLGDSIPVIGPVTQLTGGNLIAPYQIEACIGSQVCFDIGASDPDPQVLTFSWDGNIPTATFSEVGNPSVQNTISGLAPQGRFCWTAPSTPGTYRFTVEVQDHFCPIESFRQEVITIHVSGQLNANQLLSASNSLDLCAGILDTLEVPFGYPSYLWNTGATTHQILINSGGTYSVSITNSAGCLLTASHVVAAPIPIDLQGTITTSASAPLANQRVWLVRRDTSNNSLHLADSAMTDASGNYKFCAIPFDTVYVKAAPSITTYPTELPTYADTAVWWSGAVPVLSSQFPATVNFSTRFGANPGGTGFIGGLITQGANKTSAPGDPMPGVPIILWSHSLNRPVGYAVSDANGYVAFYFLTPGTYTFFTDKPGISAVNVPTFTLDPTNMLQDSLDFRLHSTYLELLQPSVSVTPPGDASLQMSVHPNPVERSATVSLSLPEASEVNLSVHDVLGRQVGSLFIGNLEAGSHSWTLDPQRWGLGQGTYFLRIKAGDTLHNLKVIVR